MFDISNRKNHQLSLFDGEKTRVDDCFLKYINNAYGILVVACNSAYTFIQSNICSFSEFAFQLGIT